MLGILGTALFALAGCSSDTDSDGQRTGRPSEIAFIRASGTRLVDETVRRTDAHVFVWRQGAEPERITSGPGEDSSPAWSPDGETIFFSRARTRDGGDTFSEIYRVDVTGGKATRVTRCKPPWCTGDSEPRISPDGKTLRFIRTGLGRSKIGTLTLPDGRPTFTSLPGRLKPYTSPSWRSADQVTLSAYGRGTKVRAYATTPSLRPLELLPICEQAAKCAVPGPISWSTDPAGEGAVEATLGNDPAIFLVSDEPAADPAIRCFDGKCPHNPAISPDGGHLAFDAGDDFGGDLYLSDSNGRSIRRITTGKDLDCCAAWRPWRPGGSGDGTSEAVDLRGRTFISTKDWEGGGSSFSTPVTVAFKDDGGMTWVAQCNTAAADVEITADRLLVGEIASTAIGCPDRAAEQDSDLADFFGSDPAWHLEGNRLTLSGNSIEVALQAEAER